MYVNLPGGVEAFNCRHLRLRSKISRDRDIRVRGCLDFFKLGSKVAGPCPRISGAAIALGHSYRANARSVVAGDPLTKFDYGAFFTLALPGTSACRICTSGTYSPGTYGVFLPFRYINIPSTLVSYPPPLSHCFDKHQYIIV